MKNVCFTCILFQLSEKAFNSQTKRRMAVSRYFTRYTVIEVEEMLMDTNLLREAVNEIKYLSGECIYEGCYGGAF